MFWFLDDGKAGVSRPFALDVFFDIEAGLTVASCLIDESDGLRSEFSGNCDGLSPTGLDRRGGLAGVASGACTGRMKICSLRLISAGVALMAGLLAEGRLVEGRLAGVGLAGDSLALFTLVGFNPVGDGVSLCAGAANRLAALGVSSAGTCAALVVGYVSFVGSIAGSGFTPGVFALELRSPVLRVLWDSEFGLAAVRAAGDGPFVAGP